MPINDIRSNLQPKLAFLASITTDTTTNGAIIDTADFDGGIVFNFLCTVYGAGTYTPILEESDDASMSGANDIADANLIGTEAGAALSAATVSGANLKSIGIFGTKRYVRVKILSATATTSTIVATFNGVPEVMPSADLSA
jgi:uncharacterized protein YjbI with pentapeptide repeats